MKSDKLNRIKVEPKLDNIEMVTQYIEDGFRQLGVSMKIITKFNIALDEIFSNIVYYGEADMVEAGYGIEQGKAVLVIKDNGKQYNPLEKEEPDITLNADDRPIGGLGICIFKKLMDDMTYTRQDGQNILVIKKTID